MHDTVSEVKMTRVIPWHQYLKDWIEEEFLARPTLLGLPKVNKAQGSKDPTTPFQFHLTPRHSQELPPTGTQ